MILHENLKKLRDLAEENGIGTPTARAKLANVSDAQTALAGLNELSDAVLSSGIPQALLLFGVTYKLMTGIADAPQEARDELSVVPGY